MPPVDVPALRALLAKATKGPWIEDRYSAVRGQTSMVVTADQSIHVATVFPSGEGDGFDDARLIVALRNSAESLLDRVETLSPTKFTLRAADTLRILIGKCCCREPDEMCVSCAAKEIVRWSISANLGGPDAAAR